MKCVRRVFLFMCPLVYGFWDVFGITLWFRREMCPRCVKTNVFGRERKSQLFGSFFSKEMCLFFQVENERDCFSTFYMWIFLELAFSVAIFFLHAWCLPGKKKSIGVCSFWWKSINTKKRYKKVISTYFYLFLLSYLLIPHIVVWGFCFWGCIRRSSSASSASSSSRLPPPH